MGSRITVSPPRPRQAVHVGVIGHRLNRIVSSRVSVLPTECSEILKHILKLSRTNPDALVYSAETPLLRVISPLAEGADRMVAQAGLDIGAEIQCPLPFHADEYALDFRDEASKQEFSNLLGRATAVFELQGSRDDEPHSYELAGRVVIAQSDLILAIWDGELANGRGGTTQMIEEALTQSLPVVWLHATEHRDPCVLEYNEVGERTTRPLNALNRLFTPKKQTVHEDVGNSVGRKQHRSAKASFDLSHAYCEERQPWLDGSQFYTAFRNLMVNGRLPWRVATLRNFNEAALEEWGKVLSVEPAIPSQTRDFLLGRLCPHYAWADGLSTSYSGLIRSSSIATNVFSALAVCFALLGVFFLRDDSTGIWHQVASDKRWERVPTIIELVLICLILGITFVARYRRWHERWLNYRQLAERIRQYFFLAPLGSAAPVPRALPHFGPDPTRSWVDGTFHAIVRDAGLAPAIVTHGYLESIGKFLDAVLTDQVKYHEKNHHTMECLTERLHLAGSILFGFTLVMCAVHLFGGYSERPFFILVATLPPAFGAAFYGITNQGEFARSADRSAAMREVLDSLRARDLAQALVSEKALYEELRLVSIRVAETMIAETLDWNAVFRYRSLNLPG